MENAKLGTVVTELNYGVVQV